ncbi:MULTISPECIES: LytR C-terminal domain-containing protein [Curtobacterium]|uniref:LytR C-terminal domain-containing protein n=1 Tax=Curtobacterium TaxID=2034 RepID=UPI000486D02D|nr:MULTISPECIES: LytR C-terminal domain-containing protein [Curtobacterium]MBT1632399.1 LytR C-terminal domain-containing protein [Curtobacterium flaccumfaciens pv. oortii]MBT1668855.1 LytR C-terminal domain-containing protein [Curtobacterium flaccumfaciens pv. flaccumfaciens]MCE0456820.1 LytR C-terminal domain-containing protein [Curtobacterium allii]MCS5506658.1 LytR C-terminal domain-containing protein [Curtobacterium flaccumfaciens pv. flaccumfaciens]MCS5511812.1 LytR C-terminal domain-con
MSTRFPRDRFDDVADGPRVGAHRGAQRRGRGWIVFAWAALATGVLVGVAVLALAVLNGSYSFNGSDSPSTSTSTSATAKPSATSKPSASSSAGSGSAGAGSAAAATPAQQGTTTVVVLNGTTTTGLASRASAALTGAGWQVASTGDAGTTGSTSTIVYYQQASQAAVAQGIAKQLGVTAVQQSAAFPNADVSVVLGADYTG